MNINFYVYIWGYWRRSQLEEKVQDTKNITILLVKTIYRTAPKKILR
jgi:hypothetical protein